MLAEHDGEGSIFYNGSRINAISAHAH